MRPRVTVITLGVADLERAVGFYRDGLGWATEGIIGTEFEYGAVCFFDLDGGGRLAFTDGHAGDWSEWPERLRVRQLPVAPGPVRASSC